MDDQKFMVTLKIQIEVTMGPWYQAGAKMHNMTYEQFVEYITTKHAMELERPETDVREVIVEKVEAISKS